MNHFHIGAHNKIHVMGVRPRGSEHGRRLRAGAEGWVQGVWALAGGAGSGVGLRMIGLGCRRVLLGYGGERGLPPALPPCSSTWARVGKGASPCRGSSGAGAAG